MKAGDGSGLALPPAFVVVNPRQHRRYKKGNKDQVDGQCLDYDNCLCKLFS